MAQKWKYREHIGKQGKFRVGDLVTVSAYALTTEHNDALLVIDHAKLVGIIVKIGDHRSDKYPIKVDWINAKSIATGLEHIKPPKAFFFRELKLKRT